jgi:gliding motility-associated-like protein
MVPVMSFTNDTSYSCETTSINFTNTSAYPSGSTFLWNFGDGTTSLEQNPSHVYADSGIYQVTLTITTAASCVNDTTQTVEAIFYPLPVAEFLSDPNTTEVFNAKVQFTDLSQNAISWQWNFGDGDKSTEQHPLHYFGDVGEFKVTLIVTNVTGCVDEISKEIVVNPFYIPNAFTPNGDGNNEYFFDAASSYNLDVQSFRLTIFNRWGQPIYEADSNTKYWDGTDRDGQKVPEGVYVYKIEVTTKNSKKHLFNGTVTLLR